MTIGIKMQDQLEEILLAGASIKLSAKWKTLDQLIDLAKCAKKGGSQLTLMDIGTLRQGELIDIAKAGRGHVTLNS